MNGEQIKRLLTQRFVLLVIVILIIGGLSFTGQLDAERGVNLIIGILVGAGVIEGGLRAQKR